MSFKDILGQDKAIALLEGYIKAGRLEGGYLFSGPEGIGKKMTALTLAKALNCLESDTEACGTCASCKKIQSRQHPDIHFIDDSEGEIKIEFIRSLQKEISLKPYEAKRKVFIIDNAHKLNAESSNALLKILEEPPGLSLLILITDKPHLLFKTIVSRCKVVKFSPLARAELEEMLKNKFSFDKDTAHYLAYFSEGRIGRALGLKDSDILREKNAAIDKFVFSARFNADDFPSQDKVKVKSYLNVLASWYRDVYLTKIGTPQIEVINSDRKSDLSKQAVRLSFEELAEIMNSISNTIYFLDRHINTRLLLHNLGAQLWKD